MSRCTVAGSCHFYPRSPCGERPVLDALSSDASTFLSTLSLRRATHCHRLQKQVFAFLSTLSLRRATITFLGLTAEELISIHALLAESDAGKARSGSSTMIFLSTLSLRRATITKKPPLIVSAFLSTLSLRRATINLRISICHISYFYPRSPCGERLGAPVDRMPSSSISIHALLAESDWRSDCPPSQSAISIHALLAESDAPDKNDGGTGG